MLKPPIKYNPAFLSDDDLCKAFVVRNVELEDVVQVVRENTTEANQHVLIVGQRGSGKTMLIRRISLEVRRDEKLCEHWYPLLFAEESYEVGSAGEFWLEAIFHLGNQTGDPQWSQVYDELKQEGNDDRLLRQALAQLMDFADHQGKRILMVVENLNMILGQQIDDDCAWKLRHTLMHEPRVMLLATATARLDSADNTNKAMYEMFKTISLPPLDDTECRAIWKSIAGHDLGPKRIRALSILTGGNPRLLTIISHFGARMSFAGLLQELTGLVDDHTDYFKSHLESLPPTERKVYVALADLWNPATAKEVANATRQNVSQTSSFLKRLIGRGAVTEVPSLRRTKKYRVTERLYNIYYLMRRRGAPSDRVKAAVWFMVQFYDEDGELVEATKRLCEEACALDGSARQYHYYAFEQILSQVPTGLRKQIMECAPRNFLNAPDTPASLRDKLNQMDAANIPEPCVPGSAGRQASELCNIGRKAMSEANYIEAEKAFREAVSVDNTCSFAWVMLGEALARDPKRHDEADKVYKKAIEADGQDAWIWTSYGIFNHNLHEKERAEYAFRKAIELNPTYDWAWTNLGDLLAEDAARLKEAEEAYRQATESSPDESYTWTCLGLFLAEKCGRYDEAACAFRKATEVGVEDAWAWCNLGELLDEKLGCSDEAIEAYKKSLALEENQPWIWFSLGQLLSDEPECSGEAEKAFRQAVKLKPELSSAWIRLGDLLREDLEKHEEAEEAYRKAIEVEPGNEWAWVGLGQLLRKYSGRSQEAVMAFRKATEMNPKSVAGWSLLGQLLYECFGKHEEAESAYRKALEVDPGHAWGWWQLARILHVSGRYDEAEAAYKKSLEILPCAQGWAALGCLFQEEEVGKYAEAEAAFRKAIDLEPGIAQGWVWLGCLLHEHLNRNEEAEEAFIKAIEVDGRDWKSRVVYVDFILAHHGDTERALKLAEEAIGVFPQAAGLFNALAWIFYQKRVASQVEYGDVWARQACQLEPLPDHQHTLACILSRMGKTDEALSILRELLEQPDFISRCIDDMITLFAELATARATKEALKILAESASDMVLEPVLVALQKLVGIDTSVALEIDEVANDVVQRFKEFSESIGDVRSEVSARKLVMSNPKRFGKA